MRVIRDDIWLCTDCLVIAVNGDASSLDYHYDAETAEKRLAEIESGLEGFGPHLVPDFDSESGEGIEEFSRTGCDCCNEWRAGARHRFAVLGP